MLLLKEIIDKELQELVSWNPHQYETEKTARFCIKTQSSSRLTEVGVVALAYAHLIAYL